MIYAIKKIPHLMLISRGFIWVSMKRGDWRFGDLVPKLKGSVPPPLRRHRRWWWSEWGWGGEKWWGVWRLTFQDRCHILIIHSHKCHDRNNLQSIYK